MKIKLHELFHKLKFHVKLRLRQEQAKREEHAYTHTQARTEKHAYTHT